MSAAAEIPSPKPSRVERLNPLPLVLAAALVGGTLIVSAFVLSRRARPAVTPRTEAPAAAMPDFLSRPPAASPPSTAPPEQSDDDIRRALEAGLRDQLGFEGTGAEPASLGADEAGGLDGGGAWSQHAAAPAHDPGREAFGRALRSPVLVPIAPAESLPSSSGDRAAGKPAPTLLDELGIPREPGAPAALAPPGIGALVAAFRPTLEAAGVAAPAPTKLAAASRAEDRGDDGREGVRFGPPFDRSRGIRAGTLLPAQLVTGIDSSLPGDVLAQIERDVYSEDQSRLLIPRGARLLGRADARAVVGQNRLLVAWTRLLLPNGRSLEFPGLPAHGTTGEAGLPGRVRTHAARAFGNAILLSLVATGLQLSQPQESGVFGGVGAGASPRQIAAAAFGQELAQVATEILRRDLSRAPTIRVAAGTRFLVFLNTDLPIEAGLAGGEE